MDLVVILLLIFIACCILAIIASYRKSKYGNGYNVKMQLRDEETGRVAHSGSGRSYGSAAVDLCYKLYSGAPTTKISSIQDRIRSMNKVINDYSGRMKEEDLRRCESYRNRLVKRVNDLERNERSRKQQAEAERQRKQQEQKEEQRKRAAERRQKEKEAEQARIEKEKNMSEQKRYIAAQRRLMTDSLRYDVLHRDDFRCVLCGASPKDNPNIKLHVDHIVPLAKGGKTEMSNLRTLCERCNLGKRDKIENGMVPSGQNVDASNKQKKVTRPVSADITGAGQHTEKNETDVLSVLKEKGISYIDKRDLGGNLWVPGGHELDGLMAELKNKGFRFYFKEEGGKATKHEPAWFLSK